MDKLVQLSKIWLLKYIICNCKFPRLNRNAESAMLPMTLNHEVGKFWLSSNETHKTMSTAESNYTSL